MLPIYKIIINDDDETGCTTISLVDNPAVELPFLCFSKDGSYEGSPMLHKLSVNDEKQTISGIAMLADTPIYRQSPTKGEYYIVFEKDTIRKMVEKYAKNGYYNLVNLQHQSDRYVNDVYMCESIIIDKQRGICPIEFESVTDGSWYVSFHIEDTDLWNEIKTSEHFNGFSIEVLSDLKLIENNNEMSSLDSRNEIIKRNDMNKIFKLAKMVLKLSDYPTDKGVLIIDGEIEVGKPVFIDVDGEPLEAENGEYTLEDGRVITIEMGVIVKIDGETPVEEPTEETLEETVEVVPTNDEIEELKKKIEELNAVILEKDNRIAELEAEIEALKGTVEEQEIALKVAKNQLKMSVETPITKKKTSKENKALKYFL